MLRTTSNWLNSFIPIKMTHQISGDRALKEDTGVSAREQREWLRPPALSDPHSAALHLR
jgi:hypothetical protein